MTKTNSPALPVDEVVKVLERIREDDYDWTHQELEALDNAIAAVRDAERYKAIVSVVMNARRGTVEHKAACICIGCELMAYFEDEPDAYAAILELEGGTKS